MGRMRQTLCRNVIGMASSSVLYSLFPSETPQARTPQSGSFTVFYLDIPPGWPYIKLFPAFKDFFSLKSQMQTKGLRTDSLCMYSGVVQESQMVVHLFSEKPPQKRSMAFHSHW